MAAEHRERGAALAMALASLLFAAMGVCVKWAAPLYSAGEIVFYRSLVGAVAIALVARLKGATLATAIPAAHFWRSATGVIALLLWFTALGGAPLATAMTLNYMSSVWLALFVVGGSVVAGAARIEPRLVACVLLGFAGVALVLRPTLDQQQLWFGLAGLGSGVLSALAYLQVTTLGRAGEPEERIVFYFSLGGMAVGAAWMLAFGAAAHTPRGLALLAATGLLAVAGQTLMTRAYRVGSTLVNASLQYLGIAFAFVFGMLLFGEQPSAAALAGIGLIVAAGLGAVAATTSRRRDGEPEGSRLPPSP